MSAAVSSNTTGDRRLADISKSGISFRACPGSPGHARNFPGPFSGDPMSVRQSDGDAAEQARGDQDSLQYPTNHVVAILDTQDQTARALDALVQSGFLEQEVGLLRGNEEADRLGGGSGRGGPQDWFIRLTGSVGL